MPTHRPATRIVRSFDPQSINHRVAIYSCPSCDWYPHHDPTDSDDAVHEGLSGPWVRAARTLVLSLVFNKLTCVAFVSECPKCFSSSWVHWPIDALARHRHLPWPRGWRAAAYDEALKRIAKWPHLKASFYLPEDECTTDRRTD